MKKKVLCLFSLLFYLLIACTILCNKIEEEMMTQVQIEARNTKKSGAGTSMTINAMFTDSEGNHLYQVVDGTGWKNGLRIQEMDSSRWSIDINPGGGGYYLSIIGGEDYRFVSTASRQPSSGEMVRIIEELETVTDQYLLTYPDGVPEELQLSDKIAVIGQTETDLLLEAKDGHLPFLPQTLKVSSDTTNLAQRLFSMTEVKQFLENLPAVTAVIAVLAAGILLWGLSCCLSIHIDDNKGLLLLNLTLILASLLCLQYLLGKVDLPSSLLPSKNILNWQYYLEEYSLIFESLNTLERDPQNLISARDMAFQSSAHVLFIGLFLSTVIVFLESVIPFLKMRRSKRKKYAGKYLKAQR